MEYINRRNTNSFKWDRLHCEGHSDELLPMWVADMDFKCAPNILEAIEDYAKNPFGYYRVPEEYFNNFIAWQKKYHDYEVKKEWLIYLPGVVSGIAWVLNCFGEKGDKVILTTPVYSHFFYNIEKCGMQVVKCPLKREKEGRFNLDFDLFEKYLKEEKPKFHILCNPHNPCGVLWREEEIKKIVSLCEKYDVILISDEIHQDFVNPKYGLKKISVGNYSDKVFVLTSATKSFNLAATQNAFLIIKDEKNREIVKKYAEEIAIEAGNGLGYVATSAAYSGGREWFEEVRDYIYTNYEYVKEELLKIMPKALLCKLEATYLLWVDLSAYFNDEKELRDFCENKCKFLPSYGCEFGGEDYSLCIRLNLATSKENIKTVLENIKKNL